MAHVSNRAKDGVHRRILIRCGSVLIAVGVLDIACLAWCLSRGISYNSSFNVFAVLGGFLLLRGELKVARWVAMLSSFTLAAGFGSLFVMPFIFPPGYWLAVFRGGGGAVLSALVAISVFALQFWLRKELHRPEVRSAQADAGIARPRVVPPMVLGILLPLALGGFLGFLYRGDTAREAIRRAEQQVGGGYHLVVTNLTVSSNMREKRVLAIVAAYNDSELKSVRVSWKE